MEARSDAEQFYKAERQQWSEQLRHALDGLVADASLTHRAAWVAERMHEATSEDVVVE
ncbi:MAG: hypothetical protein ABI960_07440 [Candidatus Eisenbacteria bacterium]